MSTIPSFLVGLVASGVGYAYLSRDLVTSRNQLMLKHFKADGVEPYHPVRKVMSSAAVVPWGATPYFTGLDGVNA